MTGPVTLLVLAKAPVPGLATTRLTPPFSPHQAAALAAAALLDTLDAIRGAHRLIGGPTPVVALTGDLARAAAADALRTSLRQLRVIHQRGDSLGERIAAAHADAGPSTLQIGMDTPQVDAALLAGIAGRLVAGGGPAAVLGPATDGGWWALGLRDSGQAGLLVSVPTSTPFTGERTRRALRRGGSDPELVAPLTDVDDAETCAAVAAQAPGTRFARLAQTLAEGVPA